MTIRTPQAAALLALLALSTSCATRPAAAPAPAPALAAAPRPAEPGPSAPEPTTPEETLPGIPLDGLTPGQRQEAAAYAREAFCYCGTPHTLSQRLRQPEGGCHHAKKMGRLVAKLAGAGLTRQELDRALAGYYASFEPRQRVHLDLAAFGPPLGQAAAPVTLVEFSDFTCPFCQLLRPELEKFVEERQDRVKLFYKPFPIESHPNAAEAAQAGEWARQQGAFWPMHDLLFSNPHAHAVDDLAGYARQLGLDAADLRAALAEGRFAEKVKASQVEAREAGLRGTPTLYFDGRRHVLPDFSDWMLEYTLQDEEEWLAHDGWAHDERP